VPVNALRADLTGMKGMEGIIKLKTQNIKPGTKHCFFWNLELGTWN
jgi:hypothetical protein